MVRYNIVLDIRQAIAGPQMVFKRLMLLCNYTFYCCHNTNLIANTEIVLDPNKAVVYHAKSQFCTKINEIESLKTEKSPGIILEKFWNSVFLFLYQPWLTNSSGLSLFLAVRFGRVPKKEKARIIEQMQKVNLQVATTQMSSILISTQDLVQSVILAHKQTCDLYQEKVQMMRDIAMMKNSFVDCPAHMVSILRPFVKSV